MKQEMRKLNRAKYACSEEEIERLSAQGYVPAGTAAAAGPPGTASVTKDKDPAVPKAAAGRKGRKDKKTDQPAADPAQAAADGGGSGT